MKNLLIILNAKKFEICIFFIFFKRNFLICLVKLIKYLKIHLKMELNKTEN